MSEDGCVGSGSWKGDIKWRSPIKNLDAKKFLGYRSNLEVDEVRDRRDFNEFAFEELNLDRSSRKTINK